MHDTAHRGIAAKVLHHRDDQPIPGLDRWVAAYGGFINPVVAVLLVTAAWICGEHAPQGAYLALAAVTLSGYPRGRCGPRGAGPKRRP